MALTLIKETGAGLVDANAYANAADGDAYHDGHLYASAWTAATLANKEKALVMATWLIDGQYQFNGVKADEAQARQWPRRRCRLPDSEDELPADSVPKAVIEATCEMARELLVADRTAAPAGEGLKYHNTGTEQTGYDKNDTPPVIPRLVQAHLAKYGALLKSRSGAVQLTRT
ncbi:MAG TPA: hypothetical protein PKO21_04705 [Verrucomicrobiota bacterium]|nr:hypothetical protein [Verrucomicrobiota bacterium]